MGKAFLTESLLCGSGGRCFLLLSTSLWESVKSTIWLRRKLRREGKHGRRMSWQKNGSHSSMLLALHCKSSSSRRACGFPLRRMFLTSSCHSYASHPETLSRASLSIFHCRFSVL